MFNISYKDERLSGKEPNAEFFVALFVSLNGSREPHIMLTRDAKEEIAAPGTAWQARIKILGEYREAIRRASSSRSSR